MSSSNSQAQGHLASEDVLNEKVRGAAQLRVGRRD